MKSIKIIVALLLFQFACTTVLGQEAKPMVRLAKLVIDSVQLESYKSFLKEEIETSLRLEPGVFTLYAVAEKEKPNYITILEM